MLRWLAVAFIKAIILVLKGLLPWVPAVAWEGIQAFLIHLFDEETPQDRLKAAKQFHNSTQTCIGDLCFYRKSEIPEEEKI